MGTGQVNMVGGAFGAGGAQEPGGEAKGAGRSGSGEGNGAQALVVAARPDGAAPEPKFPFAAILARLPVEVDVVIPVRPFRVREMLALAPGQVIASQWALSNDMPLSAGEVQLAWTEFEVIDGQLAVRVTRLP